MIGLPGASFWWNNIMALILSRYCAHAIVEDFMPTMSLSRSHHTLTKPPKLSTSVLIKIITYIIIQVFGKTRKLQFPIHTRHLRRMLPG